MSAAVFGLLGVIVGGLLNGGIAYLAERRARAREVRIAARLVSDELFIHAALAETSSAAGRWVPGPRDVNWDAWASHRALLADALHHQEWRLCRVARRRLDFTTTIANSSQPGAPLAEPDRVFLDAAAEMGLRAGAVLDAVAESKRSVRRRPSLVDHAEISHDIAKVKNHPGVREMTDAFVRGEEGPSEAGDSSARPSPGSADDEPPA